MKGSALGHRLTSVDTQRGRPFGLSGDALLGNGICRVTRVMSLNLSEQQHICVKI